MEIWSQMGHSDVECQLPKRYLEGSFFFLMGLLVSEQILFSINPDLWCNNPCARCNQWISGPGQPMSFRWDTTISIACRTCLVPSLILRLEGIWLWVETHQRHQTHQALEGSHAQMFSRMRLFRITTEPETSIFINFDKATQRDVRQVGWFFCCWVFWGWDPGGINTRVFLIQNVLPKVHETFPDGKFSVLNSQASWV